MRTASFSLAIAGGLFMFFGVVRGFGEGVVRISDIRLAVYALDGAGKDGSPDGGPAFLYAGTRRGLYRSSDEGKSWRRILGVGVWAGPVRAVALNPSVPRTLCVSAGRRLFRSSDGGERWEKLFLAPSDILCAAFDPRRSGPLLIGTREGLWRLENGDASWTAAGGIPARPVFRILFHPSVPGVCWALTEAGLFRSVDGGGMWERVWIRVRLSEASSDGGEEEEPTELLEEEETVHWGDIALDLSGRSLFVGTDRGVLVMGDDREGWQRLPAVGLGTPAIRCLLAGPERSGSLLAATSEGLFRFDPWAGIWSAWGEGLAAGTVHALAFSHNRTELLAGTEEGLFSIPLPAPERPAPPASLPFPEPLPAVSDGLEPGIREVQEAAIRYGEVMPEKILGWRRSLLWRNWFPRFTLSLDRDSDSTIASATSGGRTSFSVGPEDESISVGFGFTWDLANLIWDPAQTSVDVRSRLMVQLRQEILEEVTRLYFERRRLLEEFLANPSADPALRRERSLRIAELTAHLDAMTGGFFSDTIHGHDPGPVPRGSLRDDPGRESSGVCRPASERLRFHASPHSGAEGS